MTAPAARLLAAADLLDKRASGATEGPWDLDMHSPDMAGRHGWRMRGPRSLGLTGTVMDTRLTAGDAHYIATVHPEVGKLLASTLREAAHTIENNVNVRIPRGMPPVQVASACLLDLADLLLAGES